MRGLPPTVSAGVRMIQHDPHENLKLMSYRDKGHQKRLLPASGTMEDKMMDHFSMLPCCSSYTIHPVRILEER